MGANDVLTEFLFFFVRFLFDPYRTSDRFLICFGVSCLVALAMNTMMSKDEHFDL